jgi:arylsulfatase A-like enzyme
VFGIRQGPWKYVEGKPAKPANRVPAARKGELTAQLYNLKDDPGERRNLHGEKPEVAARLAALLNAAREKGSTRY